MMFIAKTLLRQASANPSLFCLVFRSTPLWFLRHRYDGRATIPLGESRVDNARTRCWGDVQRSGHREAIGLRRRRISSDLDAFKHVSYLDLISEVQLLRLYFSFSIEDEWIKRPQDSHKPSFKLLKNVSVKKMTPAQRNALQDHVNFITKTPSRSGSKQSRKSSSTSSSSTCSSGTSVASSTSTWPLRPALIVKEQAKRGRGRPRNVIGKCTKKAVKIL